MYITKVHIFVVILISNCFKTYKMPVVCWQRICLSDLGCSSRTISQPSDTDHQCHFIKLLTINPIIGLSYWVAVIIA